MKIKYVATDGKEFNSEQECYKYEREINTVSKIVPELVIEEKLVPFSVLFNKYILKSDGYCISENNCIFENFELKSYVDKLRIIDALKDLGYYSLANTINEHKIIYPDILCLVSSMEFNSRSYLKYAFLQDQANIAMDHVSKIAHIIVDFNYE